MMMQRMMIQQIIQSQMQRTIHTLCSSSSNSKPGNPTLTLEAAITGCKHCEFFESDGNKCRAFAFTQPTTEMKTNSPEIVTILEARCNPRLCGIEGKMLFPHNGSLTNIILTLMICTPCAILTMYIITKPFIQ